MVLVASKLGIDEHFPSNGGVEAGGEGITGDVEGVGRRQAVMGGTT